MSAPEYELVLELQQYRSYQALSDEDKQALDRAIAAASDLRQAVHAATGAFEQGVKALGGNWDRMMKRHYRETRAAYAAIGASRRRHV